MERFSGRNGCTEPSPLSPEVYRIIDDGTCVLTTLDARKALLALMKLLDKHEINHCWADAEVLK